MVLTNDENLRVRLIELKDQGRPLRGTGGDDVHYSIGYNFKLTNLQAAVGLAQLKALDGRLERQKKIYLAYEKGLDGLTGVRLIGFRIGGGEVPQWTDALVERRDALVQHLEEKGMSCRRFWFPIHRQAPYRLPDDRYPNSTELAQRAVWLPSAFTLTDEDVVQVCEEIWAFMGRGRKRGLRKQQHA